MRINKEKLELALAKEMMDCKELSERVGITQESISKIRAGKQNPRPATVGKIANALNVSVEDIIEGGE